MEQPTRVGRRHFERDGQELIQNKRREEITKNNSMEDKTQRQTGGTAMTLDSAQQLN